MTDTAEAPTEELPAAPEPGERRIDYLPVRRIPVAAVNVKGHDLSRIRGSIERWGFTAPLLLDERTRRLVAGHGRLEVVTTMERESEKDDRPPSGVRVSEYGEWLLPVVRGWSSKDDREASAYAVADNRLTEVGGWDDRGLAELLRELDRKDDGIVADAGFEDRELRRLLQALNTAPATPPDAFPVLNPDQEFDHECPRCQFQWNDKD